MTVSVSGLWEQIAKLSKTATLKFINSTLLIAPIAVTLTIIGVGSKIKVIYKIYQKTVKSFGALKINVTHVFLKQILKT